MKWILICLLLLATPAASQTALQCKVAALHMEARGEPLKAARGVLDVLNNRMKKHKLSACAVVKAKGQWPWAARKTNWKFSQQMLDRYFKVMHITPVLNRNYLFFNHVPHPFGKSTVKIGNLYFSK